eukprot:6174185-Pleurochrysis_carterae.AAC.1
MPSSCGERASHFADLHRTAIMTCRRDRHGWASCALCEDSYSGLSVLTCQRQRARENRAYEWL